MKRNDRRRGRVDEIARTLVDLLLTDKAAAACRPNFKSKLLEGRAS